MKVYICIIFFHSFPLHSTSFWLLTEIHSITLKRLVIEVNEKQLKKTDGNQGSSQKV